MKVTLESTTEIVEINGVAARIWQGQTDSGIEVHAFITRIAVDKDADVSEFERELKVCTPPRASVAGVYPIRMFLP